MTLGDDLKALREERHLSLRDVERLAKEASLGVELSNGYLSMLEGGKVRNPAPRVLFALAQVYEVDYLELMKAAGYLPADAEVASRHQAVAFRGASRLSPEQRERIQRQIDFEIEDARRRKREGTS